MMTGAFSQNVGKLFSELKLVTDNLLSIYAAANWEATERYVHVTVLHVTQVEESGDQLHSCKGWACIYCHCVLDSLRSKPPLASWTVNILSLIRNLYVCLDCNLRQPRGHVRTLCNIFALLITFQHEHYGQVDGVWTFTVRALQVVKTNMATYRMQKQLIVE